MHMSRQVRLRIDALLFLLPLFSHHYTIVLFFYHRCRSHVTTPCFIVHVPHVRIRTLLYYRVTRPYATQYIACTASGAFLIELSPTCRYVSLYISILYLYLIYRTISHLQCDILVRSTSYEPRVLLIVTHLFRNHGLATLPLPTRVRSPSHRSPHHRSPWPQLRRQPTLPPSSLSLSSPCKNGRGR
jgi:hypothetical protein